MSGNNGYFPAFSFFALSPILSMKFLKVHRHAEAAGWRTAEKYQSFRPITPEILRTLVWA
ncbi:hypothetical protein ACEUKI_10390 [Bifidobacterium sp. 2450]